jgi:hypothetical protein
MKINKINIVEDFNSKLENISEKYGIKIDSNFRALNKSKFFDLKNTDEIQSIQIVLNIKKCIDNDRKLYESVSRNNKFGTGKFDKLNKSLSECFNWFLGHSNLNKFDVYRKDDNSLGEIIIRYEF